MNNKCKAITKKGNPCKKFSIGNTGYCDSHKPQEKGYQNDCPICLENSASMLILNCSHQIHEECCSGLIRLDCPICKESVKWPENIRKQIEKNQMNKAIQLKTEK